MSPARPPWDRWPTSARAAVVVLLGLLALAAVGVGRDDGDSGDAGPTTSAVPSSTAPPTASSSDPATSSSSTTTAGGPTSAVPTTDAGATTTTAGAPVPPLADLPLPLPDLPAAGLLDRLVVASPSPDAPPYERDLMDGGDWAYDPASGCNTRERVLIEEALVEPTVDDRCRSTGGRWRSSYDGVETTDVADLQIDHLVPLADAWRAGAWRWAPDQRLSFANDLTSPDTLIAVTGSTNTSKGDSTPDQWLPPDRGAWCGYASAWVRVKARWALEVTAPEKAKLAEVLAGC